MASLEEALAYEKKRNESFHRQLLALVDHKILDWTEKAPELPRLPADLRPKPATRIGRLGKRSQSFVGQVRDAIIARSVQEFPKDAA